MEIKNISTDVLIVGSGGAGSRAAIEVDEAGLKATIVSKGLSFRSGCTGMAEGGYNAVFKAVDKDDSIEAHIKDTLKGGSYLNDKKLVDILQRLVGNGNTVVVIEHNLDVVKIADYIIDMGPEGGEGGGRIVATGTPEEVCKVKESYTGLYLSKVIKRG